jgi:hypothetical protein
MLDNRSTLNFSQKFTCLSSKSKSEISYIS